MFYSVSGEGTLERRPLASSMCYHWKMADWYLRHLKYHSDVEDDVRRIVLEEQSHNVLHVRYPNVESPFKVDVGHRVMSLAVTLLCSELAGAWAKHITYLTQGTWMEAYIVWVYERAPGHQQQLDVESFLWHLFNCVKFSSMEADEMEQLRVDNADWRTMSLHFWQRSGWR